MELGGNIPKKRNIANFFVNKRQEIQEMGRI